MTIEESDVENMPIIDFVPGFNFEREVIEAQGLVFSPPLLTVKSASKEGLVVIEFSHELIVPSSNRI